VTRRAHEPLKRAQLGLLTLQEARSYLCFNGIRRRRGWLRCNLASCRGLETNPVSPVRGWSLGCPESRSSGTLRPCRPLLCRTKHRRDASKSNSWAYRPQLTAVSNWSIVSSSVNCSSSMSWNRSSEAAWSLLASMARTRTASGSRTAASGSTISNQPQPQNRPNSYPRPQLAAP
jgi:hypothetical protein